MDRTQRTAFSPVCFCLLFSLFSCDLGLWHFTSQSNLCTKMH